MQEMEGLVLHMHRRMEECLERSQDLGERGLGNTATWTRVGRLSLLGTQLGWTGSKSLKELMFPQEPMDRTLLHMTLITGSLLLLLSNRLLPPTSTITMYMPTTMSSLPRLPTQTGTLSSTLMTQPTVTSVITLTLPTMPQETATPSK